VGVSFSSIKHFDRLLESAEAVSIQHLCKMYSTTVIEGCGRWKRGYPCIYSACYSWRL